ncbi:MAG: deoxyribose-phosphate aldolase [Candidatus Gastranaerophilales bacterium]|nr:deoxyribose-phosphate aldolase [Candidatus Gastranaerophilales bacterium]
MDLNRYIEHTILKAKATFSDIDKIIDEALKNNFLGICIPPCYIKHAKEKLKNKNIKLVTVIGFPLGATESDVKAFEAKKTIDNGADEVDMVINIGFARSNRWDLVEEDIKKVREATSNKVLKVILETDYLNDDEIKKACEICVKQKADYVKTSTGFAKNGVGATIEKIKMLSSLVKPYGLKVKASGGIKTKEDALSLIEAGADTLGTSSGCEIVK